MHTHTLFELNEHIRRVLALNYQQPVWIVAEIGQVNESRGHRYLDLVQKGEDGGVMAQAPAALWAADFRQINAKFPFGLTPLLRDGLELRMQVRPDFHERYGFRLHILDIDPAHTLGQLELMRRQTIQTLRELGLLERNRARLLPQVVQRIAVISSETAAGKQDFQEHLAGNSFGYVFECQYFFTSVQGINAETEIIAALEEISRRKLAFDCVVVVRGGGARLDLMTFDGLALCAAAAQMPLPVIVGIGHDVDETVLDLVAHSSLKTPTAVADFLVQHNLIFEGNVLEMAARISDFAENMLRYKNLELERAETATHFAALAKIKSATQQIDFASQKLPVFALQVLRNAYRDVEAASAICQHLHPENVLRRGYSITTKNGKMVLAASDLKKGDQLQTRLHDGMAISIVD